ncbi:MULTISPECIES: NAD(P)H-binding protein [unclassified Streptomyces]|uniref:NAD(P)-dependent oxidoreductase n=1 Tax=unclassified Streptomyces TaxID=2593676 RepID=UPI0005F8D723|nr:MULTISPECIES: NAD(P)H-binding protein [unclassified Streptomyces]KJY31305.1 3-beta hydroxysteroid dehydrogenase [Streptomyces sp. NRRL S-495]KOV13212.1 3-beta hydroxysteroid dehydrogenase [Streptomyces sp. XY431]
MASIAVFGANGTVGSAVLAEAAARGHRVTAVVRDPSRFDVARHAGPVRPGGVTVVAGDVLDPADVAGVAAGQDVLVSAVGGGDGPGHLTLIGPAARALVEGLRELGGGAPRLIVVGGAGSLETAPGVRVWDAPGLPEQVRQIMHAHGEALDYLRTVADVRWTVLSPAARLGPGERTGRYRTGLEQLLTDARGESRISVPDYALVLVDEIEQPEHIGERFTCCAL